jgi:hypothetical protein
MSNTKDVQLVLVSEQPYLVSEDDIVENVLCIFSVNGKLIEACPEDLLGDAIDWVKKIIATPEQIGWIKYILGVEIKEINQNQIDSILNNQGNCEIEIDKNTNEPKLFNGKIIIVL